MKKLFFLALLVTGFTNAQVFTGKGDQKFQVGANLQNGGTGIIATFDKGVGKNMSFGFTTSYLLGAKEILNQTPKFKDRFDIRARFSANIADVFEIAEKVDIYPGLNLGFKNFGAHFGVRYFFTEGFGLFSEMQFPIAKYDRSVVTGFEKLNNQFNVSIGASFNL